jgi:uncharacterized membrane protein
MEMKKITRTLNEINRFFSHHSFFPILLSSLLALVLFAGRVFRSDSLVYRNLVWNLLLAWVPYLISLWGDILHELFPRRWWLQIPSGALWLAFFPNAPYIVTDFLHLVPRVGIPLWYDILMLATYAWTGLFLAIISLRTMQDLVRTHTNVFVSWLFVGMALTLGGLGIYLGRFSRFNSWDLIFQPFAVLGDIAAPILNPLSHLRFYGFISLFSAFLLVVYLTFVTARRSSKSDRG